MTSDIAVTPDLRNLDHIFVWIFLPGRTDPVVAGRLDAVHVSPGPVYEFTYGRSYLARRDAIPISFDELPLRPGTIDPSPLDIAGALRDAAPDAWGRRVIVNRLAGGDSSAIDYASLDELVYLIESGSDRIGALDFQRSPTNYAARNLNGATLEELMRAVELIEAGMPLSPDLARALQHGTSIGGARPKASITAPDAKYIVKFSSSNDTFNVVRAEAAAMRLARKAGIDVADVHVEKVAGKDALLVKRFDRTMVAEEAGGRAFAWTRRLMASALSLLKLDEMQARYAGYDLLASEIRRLCRDQARDLRELFRRMIFNIAIGNTDDHARNTAFFFDGAAYDLTPAYDIVPMMRTGGEASQAMAIWGDRRESNLAVALGTAHHYLLTSDEAWQIASEVVGAVDRGWDAATHWAGMPEVDNRMLRQRTVLHESIFRGAELLSPS